MPDLVRATGMRVAKTGAGGSAFAAKSRIFEVNAGLQSRDDDVLGRAQDRLQASGDGIVVDDLIIFKHIGKGFEISCRTFLQGLNSSPVQLVAGGTGPQHGL